jgi:hypothetical protein
MLLTTGRFGSLHEIDAVSRKHDSAAHMTLCNQQSRVEEADAAGVQVHLYNHA